MNSLRNQTTDSSYPFFVDNVIADVLALFQDVRILSKVENLFGFRVREVERKADRSRPLSAQGLDHVQTIERELESIQRKENCNLQCTNFIKSYEFVQRFFFDLS